MHRHQARPTAAPLALAATATSRKEVDAGEVSKVILSFRHAHRASVRWLASVYPDSRAINLSVGRRALALHPARHAWTGVFVMSSRG
jgi:hypothetical protein